MQKQFLSYLLMSPSSENDNISTLKSENENILKLTSHFDNDNSD